MPGWRCRSWWGRRWFPAWPRVRTRRLHTITLLMATRGMPPPWGPSSHRCAEPPPSSTGSTRRWRPAYELGWVNGAGVRVPSGACVAHPTAGAMGYHYFNAALMADDAADAPGAPRSLVCARTPDGVLDLVAVEWVVEEHTVQPARCLSGSVCPRDADAHPGSAAGPAFYLMHAWVWKDNPAGMFADFNPDVTCR